MKPLGNGRKRKRNHFYSRTGSGSIDGRTATISTSVCYPRPTRQVVLATNESFIKSQPAMCSERGNKSSSPKEMLTCSPYSVFIIIEIEMIPVIYPCTGYKRKNNSTVAKRVSEKFIGAASLLNPCLIKEFTVAIR